MSNKLITEYKLISELTRGQKIDAFEELIVSHGAKSVAVFGGKVSRTSLISLFKKSSDILPSSYCDRLDLPAGSSYADAARALKAQPVH